MPSPGDKTGKMNEALNSYKKFSKQNQEDLDTAEAKIKKEIEEVSVSSTCHVFSFEADKNFALTNSIVKEIARRLKTRGYDTEVRFAVNSLDLKVDWSDPPDV